MSTDHTHRTRPAVHRRTVTTGLAWSVPATAAAPLAAASVVVVPGINGWVLNSARSSGGCRCEIDPEDVSADGRLRLGNFRVSARINQNLGNGCEPLDFWAYREIRVDSDGDGPLEPELMHFERRARLGGGSAGFNRNGSQAASEAAATGRTESVPA